MSKKTTTTAPLPQKAYTQKTITLPNKLYNFVVDLAQISAEERGREPNFSECISDLICEAKNRHENYQKKEAA